MTTMNISLPDAMKAFVDAQIKERGYGTSSEYIRDLIRNDQARQAEQRLAALMLEGLESGSAIPQSYVEQNHLEAGSKLALEIAGQELRIKPAKPRRSLAELLAATPDGLQRVEGWDEMPAVGEEW
jgi:antitoxin ParD1/3/4